MVVIALRRVSAASGWPSSSSTTASIHPREEPTISKRLSSPTAAIRWSSAAVGWAAAAAVRWSSAAVAVTSSWRWTLRCSWPWRLSLGMLWHLAVMCWWFWRRGPRRRTDRLHHDCLLQQWLLRLLSRHEMLLLLLLLRLLHRLLHLLLHQRLLRGRHLHWYRIVPIAHHIPR